MVARDKWFSNADFHVVVHENPEAMLTLDHHVGMPYQDGTLYPAADRFDAATGKCSYDLSRVSRPPNVFWHVRKVGTERFTCSEVPLTAIGLVAHVRNRFVGPKSCPCGLPLKLRANGAFYGCSSYVRSGNAPGCVFKFKPPCRIDRAVQARFRHLRTADDLRALLRAWGIDGTALGGASSTRRLTLRTKNNIRHALASQYPSPIAADALAALRALQKELDELTKQRAADTRKRKREDDNTESH